MPYGVPIPSPAALAPASSAKSFFQEYEDMMAPSLQANKVAAEQNYQATVDMTQAAIAHVNAMPNPIAPSPVTYPNPLLAAAAGFFGGLNQSQSGNGQMLAGAQNMLSNQVAQAQRTEAENAQSANQFSLSKAGSVEELHMSLLKAKRDEAAQMGDLDKTFQYNKSLYALERQKKKEELQMTSDLAQGKIAMTGAQRLAEIKARGAQARLTAGTVARYRQAAESHAATPAQRARLSMANAQVAELRAHLDDMRGARDIAGDPVYTDAEISAREGEIMGQIKDIYEGAIADFETAKDGARNTPPASVTNPPSTTQTTPPAGSDAVRAAAERLRGTPLFQKQ